MTEFTGTLVPPRLAAAPSSPVTGQMYYDTVLKKLIYWDGTAWIAGSSGGGGSGLPEIYIGQSPPVSTEVLWVDTDEPSGPAPPTFVSALPAVAADGQEVYFQNTVMATDGVVWHLRYRAASASAYKWELVGGTSMHYFLDTAPTTAANGWTAAPAGWPSFTVPTQGTYDFEFGGGIGATQVARDIRIGLWAGGAVQAQAYHIGFTATGWSGNPWVSPMSVLRIGLATGAVVSLAHYTSDYTNTIFQKVWMRARLVRAL